MVKYSAVGNTFVALDNRSGSLDPSRQEQWSQFAVKEGVDGILFLESASHLSADFRMRYLNADGREAEMCGNGVRSLGVFAAEVLGNGQKGFSFETAAGICKVCLEGKLPMVSMGQARQMGSKDLSGLFPARASLYLECGVPHAVFIVGDVLGVWPQEVAPGICFHRQFPKGTNVDFAQILRPGQVAMRTWERGVGRETHSCGTGAVAVAVACAKLFSWTKEVSVWTPGGELTVRLAREMFLQGEVVRLGAIDNLP